MRLSFRLMSALAAGGLAATSVAVQAREVLPIHQTVLQKRAAPPHPIYGMPVRIGSTLVETGLDTGSIGLRVLPGTLKPADATSTGTPETYAYGSGVRLTGTVAKARMALGDRAGEGRLQLINRVDCIESKPTCPASQVGSQENYGLMGQGIPRAGYRAIAGLRLAQPKSAQAPGNPVAEIGGGRYVIDLPRRGEALGQLVLDPQLGEIGGFVALPDAATAFGEPAPPNTVPGCLIDRGGGREVCGSILFDTGAPGIHVSLPQGRFEDWPVGTPARLVLGDGHGRPLAIEDFVAGPIHYGHVGGGAPRPDLSRPFISVGVTPFLAFSVLYDTLRPGLAVRPRRPQPGVPVAFLPR